MAALAPGGRAGDVVPERPQSGTHVWIACALLILVPALLILLVKYVLGL